MELLKCKCGYDHFEYLYELDKLSGEEQTISYRCKKCGKEINVVLEKSECSKIVIEQ